MEGSSVYQFFNAKLSKENFDKLSKFIYQESGIKLPPVKLVMLQSRLQKRLRTLNIKSFDEYVEYVFSDDGQSKEVIHMLDVVSTNKTDFFREPVHFDFLNSVVLPEFMVRETNKKVKIWSAGCSSGEEPYTIAMSLAGFREKNPGLDYEITGTDISIEILQKAVNGIYKEDKVQVIPLELKKKYLLRSKDRKNPTVKVVKELRNKIKFSRLNFMDTSYNIDGDYDVIFCRNVLIYFNRDKQEEVISKLCLKLKSGGYLFIGHSESIMNMNVPLIQIRPTIFKRL